MKLLSRNWYAKTGTFKGFPYMKKLNELADEQKTTAENLFYQHIGETSPLVEPAKAYELRCLRINKNKDELMKKLNVSNYKDIEACLSGLGIKVRRSPSYLSCPEKLLPYAKLLSTYLEYSEEFSAILEDKKVLVSDFLGKIKVDSKAFIESLPLVSDHLKSILRAGLPTFKLSKKQGVYISQCVFHHNEKLTDSEKNSIIEFALEDCIKRGLVIPSSVYIELLTRVDNLPFASDKQFLKLVEYSLLCKKTIEELFKEAGLRWVDLDECYSQYGWVAYALDNGVAIFNPIEDNHIILSTKQFYSLKESGSFVNSKFSNGILTLKNGMRLNDLYFSKKGVDFR
jgi:hypothetical protein